MEVDLEQEWMVEPKPTNLYRFLPLTGDSGSEVVKFLGPPRKSVSNFNPDKIEWHFDVYWVDVDEKKWDHRTISESSENFRGQVTDLVRKHGWEHPVRINWVKQKSFKGRMFKNFTFEEIDLTDLVVDEA